MWKDIKGFEGRYCISDLGEVQNIKTKKILKPTSDKDGYLHIGLRKLGDRKKYWFRVHRLYNRNSERQGCEKTIRRSTER